MRYVLIALLLGMSLNAKSNVSLAKVLLGFQSEEYNVLLSPRQIVMSGKKRKTRKAINKGYKRAIMELKREVKLREVKLNLKIFTARGSNLPQYQDRDINSYTLLKSMLEQQVSIREQIFDTSSGGNIAPTELKKTTSVDDIDMDIGDDAFDISDDKGEVADSKSGALMNISPAEAFQTGFIELSEQYGEVLQLHKVLHPFKINGKPKKKNIHSVFGMAFFPTKYGSIHTMRVYVVLCNINTETDKSVQIIAKEIPNFKWDRNRLYISAATGKIIRQIVSGVLGESL